MKPEIPLEGGNTLFENLVFIVKVWNVGHDKVKIDCFCSRLCSFNSDVVDNLG